MKRSIGVAILLTIVTCGIYGIYWMIKLNDELNALAGKQDATSGGMVFLLTLVTCGIYGFFWYYKMGENVEIIKANNGMPAGNSPVIFLVLGFVPFGYLVDYYFMQDTINKVVEG